MADLKPFNTHLYGVERGDMHLHRRDSDNQYATYYGAGSYTGYGAYNSAGDNWYPLDVSAFVYQGGAKELAEHNGKLYLSAFSYDPGTNPFLFSSSDGVNWEAVGDNSWLLSGQVDAGAMASWNSKLYLGVSNHEGSVAVFEYVEAGAELSRCEATAIEYAPAPWLGW